MKKILLGLTMFALLFATTNVVSAMDCKCNCEKKCQCECCQKGNCDCGKDCKCHQYKCTCKNCKCKCPACKKSLKRFFQKKSIKCNCDNK